MCCVLACYCACMMMGGRQCQEAARSLTQTWNVVLYVDYIIRIGRMFVCGYAMLWVM